MTTRMLQNGKDLSTVTNFERHSGRLNEPGGASSGSGEGEWCVFLLPPSTGVAMGTSTQHGLVLENGKTVTIKVTRVTGGISGVEVTALLP